MHTFDANYSYKNTWSLSNALNKLERIQLSSVHCERKLMLSLWYSHVVAILFLCFTQIKRREKQVGVKGTKVQRCIVVKLYSVLLIILVDTVFSAGHVVRKIMYIIYIVYLDSADRNSGDSKSSDMLNEQYKELLFCRQ